MKIKKNPAYESAKYVQRFMLYGKIQSDHWIPEIRTNNPHYLRDGCRVEDRIPEFIEVKNEPA